MTISGYEDVPQNSDESLVKALAHQPVSVAIEASGRDFQFYKGVYKKKITLIYSKLCVPVCSNLGELCFAYRECLMGSVEQT